MVVEPILDDLECCCRVVVQVDAVSSVGLNVCLKSTCIGKRRGNRDFWNTRPSSSSSEAVTTAVDVVVLAGEDQSRTGKG